MSTNMRSIIEYLERLMTSYGHDTPRHLDTVVTATSITFRFSRVKVIEGQWVPSSRDLELMDLHAGRYEQ